MIFGLKVHHTDMEALMDMGPEALEFALFSDDIRDETWVDSVYFNGPIAVHMQEKFKDGRLLDLASGDEKERREAVMDLKKTIDLSERLNARSIIVHPGGVRKAPVSLDPSPLLDSIEELKTYLPDNIELLLENMPAIYWYKGELYSSCLFKDSREIASILGELDVGLCMDLCHAKLYCNTRSVDFNSYIAGLKPYIRHIHVSDARGTSEEGLQIGEGEIDFPGIMPILEGLDVVAIPEILEGHKNGGAGFRIAVDRLNRMGFFEL
jgi:N-acetylneuraminate synthase